jgi:uncharacterized membrane protein YqiK
MGSNNGAAQAEEVDQLLEAYQAIRDDRVRYLMSMMIQSVAVALTEAQEYKPQPAKTRDKHRPSLVA